MSPAPEGARLYVHAFRETPGLVLDPGEMIVFERPAAKGNPSVVRLSFTKDGSIEIMTDGGPLEVSPKSSNLIEVRGITPWEARERDRERSS